MQFASFEIYVSRLIRFTILLLGLAPNLNAQSIEQLDSGLQTNHSAQTAFGEQSGTRERRKQIAVRLTSASTQLKRTQDPDNQTPTSPALEREVEILKQIDSVLAQQQAGETKLQQLQPELEQAVQNLQALQQTGMSEPSPYSFLKFSSLLTELRSAESRIERTIAEANASRDAVTAARRAKESKEADLRRAKEALSQNRDESIVAELEAAVLITELEARLADETLSLRRLESENNQLLQQIAQANVDALRRQRELMEPNVVFSESDLQEVLVDFGKDERQVQQSIQMAESRLRFAESELNSALLRNTAPNENPVQAEELAARRLEQQLRQRDLDLLTSRLTRISKSRELWNRRFKVINYQASTDELSDWAAELEDSLNAIDRERRVLMSIADERRENLATLESRLQNMDSEASEQRRWATDQQQSLQQLMLLNDRDLVSLTALHDLSFNLLAEIKGEVTSWNFRQRIERVWATFDTIWNTELTVIDDLPITVGKVLIGLSVLVIGILIARLFSRVLGNRLLKRFGMDEGAAAAIKSLTFYFLVAICALFALRIANVPLTVFTLMGGALAIGIGFGSQALINNFISGLIILAERPIQVGDLIRIDDLIGNVIQIGARSTKIRTGDNLDIIVPNSRFLENNVLNFTLADDRFRCAVTVGLAYGSATREAERLLVQAATEHPLILSDPKPFVWFRDFGSDALVFEVHMWMKVRTLGQRLRIQSDLRFRIHDLFKEAGIVIAFPQRDVHLEMTRPLEVNLSRRSAD